MKQYKYKAKKSPTETVTGLIEADTKQSALEKINDQGLMPIDLEEVKTAPAVSRVLAQQRMKAVSGGVAVAQKNWPAQELVQFYRQLSRLLKAGVPILRGLTLLAEQSKKPIVRGVLERIRDEVRQGRDFSASADERRGVFPPLDVALIQAGESVGKLQEILLELSRYRASQTELFSKLRAALSYPLFVCVVGVGTVAFMLARVIPQFSKFFEDLGQTLPMPTRVLISASHFAQAWGLFLLLIVAVLFFLFKQALRREGNRAAWHHFLLSLPLAGPLFVKAEVARIMRTLELLVGNGLPLLKALRVTVPVCGNDLFREHLAGCVKAVEQGGTLSDSLKGFVYYPEMVIYLIRTGEETGSLQEALSEISEWYENDVQTAITALTKFIEPVLILMIGLVLGAIVIALLLPVFSMNTAVS